MYSFIPSDANDPQGLMRRKEPNKQTNKQISFWCQPRVHYLIYSFFYKIFLEGSGLTGQLRRFYLCKYNFYVTLALEVGNPLHQSAPLLDSTVGGEHGGWILKPNTHGYKI